MSSPMHLVTVPAAITSAKVQRLMHIAHEMDEELERLLRELGTGRRRGQRATDKVGQNGASVLYGVENV